MTYFITGASRGIGLELARQLRARGEMVFGTVRQQSSAAALDAIGATPVLLSVDQPDSIASLPQRIGADTPIDCLINNAGVSSTSKSLADLSAAELQRVLMINAIAPMLVTQALAANLRAGRGRIIAHITSQLGSIANNTGGSSYGYRASKTALNQFNKSLANELGPQGFVCVALHPGWVRTDMGGPNATLSISDSASSLIKVLDRLSPAENGQFLNYDGSPIPW